MTLDENLNYAGAFSEGADDTFVLSGGHLLLSGAATFAGGTVDGSNILYTESTTTVSGLTIGGTVEWINTESLTQSGGTVTIGDASGDKAILDNESTGTYDITDNSGIGLGKSTASNILNAGPFEKTLDTGTSVIAPVRDQHRNDRSHRRNARSSGGGIRDGIGHHFGGFHAGVRLDGRGWPDRFVHRQRRRTRAARPGGVRRLDQRLRHDQRRIERHDRGRPELGLHRLHSDAGGTREPSSSPTMEAPSTSRSSATTPPPTSTLQAQRTEPR